MSKRIDRRRRRTPPAARAAESAGSTPPPVSSALVPRTASAGRAPLAGRVDVTDLVRVVPQLTPETLHQVIRHYGLDACGEIVAVATPAQLTSVLDLDLWRNAHPGDAPGFDPGRFGEWVELLVDADAAGAARIVGTMDEQLVVTGLSAYIRVFDLAALGAIADGEPVATDVTFDEAQECELGGYLVRGREAHGWDAIVALLLALEEGNPERFHAVMRECRRLSDSEPEVDGLDALLLQPEQVLHDAALAREDRRAQQGYSTPADARAFLQMARRSERSSSGDPLVNPIVASYFRAVSDPTVSTPEVIHASSPPVQSQSPGSTAEEADAVVDLLVRAGVLPQQSIARLEGAGSQPAPVAVMQRLIEYVRNSDEALYLARTRELAFLANTLAGGCSIQGRAFTPREASDASVAVCNLGIEHWPARWPEPLAPVAGVRTTVPDAFLIDHDLVSAFEAGWAVLHEDVGMFTAGQLVAALSELQCSDPDIQDGLDALRIELAREHAAGTPWRARGALDVIGMLDMPACAGVSGLLDECPVLPMAVTAILERRTRAVSATAFEFISTRAQLGQIREFMARFLDLLG
jgi:hypothetical protein